VIDLTVIGTRDDCSSTPLSGGLSEWPKSSEDVPSGEGINRAKSFLGGEGNLRFLDRIMNRGDFLQEQREEKFRRGVTTTGKLNYRCKFSKVSSVVIFGSRLGSVLTFENCWSPCHLLELGSNDKTISTIPTPNLSLNKCMKGRFS